MWLLELLRIYANAKKLIKKSLLKDQVKCESYLELSTNEVNRFKLRGSDFVYHGTDDGKIYINDTNIDLYDKIIHEFPLILDLACIMQYSLDEHPEFCPEYMIFNKFCNQSVVLNFNHDDLANQYIQNKKILNMHGTINSSTRRLTKRILINLEEVLPYFLNLDLRQIFGNHLYMTVDEIEEKLINVKEYQELNKILTDTPF